MAQIVSSYGKSTSTTTTTETAPAYKIWKGTLSEFSQIVPQEDTIYFVKVE